MSEPPRDVALVVDALEARDDRHFSPVEGLLHPGYFDGGDARAPMDVSGAHPYLAAGKGSRGDAALAQRHGQQRDRHLLAGGEQHIHFARIRFACDAGGEVDQSISVITHGRDNDGDTIAALAHGGDFRGHALDEFD